MGAPHSPDQTPLPLCSPQPLGHPCCPGLSPTLPASPLGRADPQLPARARAKPAAAPLATALQQPRRQRASSGCFSRWTTSKPSVGKLPTSQTKSFFPQNLPMGALFSFQWLLQTSHERSNCCNIKTRVSLGHILNTYP